MDSFIEIEHSIDPGSAPSTKLRMRRTPLGFVQKEENNLNTMLEAGIIELSNSKSASRAYLLGKEMLKSDGVKTVKNKTQ